MLSNVRNESTSQVWSTFTAKKKLKTALGGDTGGRVQIKIHFVVRTPNGATSSYYI